jgi:hypothetical protein
MARVGPDRAADALGADAAADSVNFEGAKLAGAVDVRGCVLW